MLRLRSQKFTGVWKKCGSGRKYDREEQQMEGIFMGELEETWKLFHHSVDSQVGRRVGYEIYEPRKHCRRT